MTHREHEIQLNPIEAHALSIELSERFCIRSKNPYHYRLMVIS